MVMIVPNGTQEMYDKAMETLGLGSDSGDWPEGVISHNAGPSGNNWVVVDTWESKEAFEKFFKERLHHAIQEAGMPEVEPRFFDIYMSHRS